MSTREIDTSPSDLIAFKWANALSQGEQDVLLAPSIRRLQNAINSALTKAIGDERERCAQIADGCVQQNQTGAVKAARRGDMDTHDVLDSCKRESEAIASLIRRDDTADTQDRQENADG